jgi:hypothetical protein
MIIDAILFNDELDLLQHRIDWLRNYVDVTVILEADFTFSGKPKPLIVKSNLAVLAKLTEGEIVPLQIKNKPSEGNLPDNPWKTESASREFLVKHLAVNYPLSRIIFSDLDEIPSLEQMRVISKLDLDRSWETFSIPMQVYYRYANWHQVGSGEKWNLAKTFNSSFAPSVSNIRSSSKFLNLPGIGSHLSYLSMSAEQITNKFEAFSHSELSGFGHIEDSLTRISDIYFVDHIGRFDVEGRGLIRVLDERQIHDVCDYLVKTDSKFFKGGKTPTTLKRLMASAVITELRKSKDAPKSFFHGFAKKSVERNIDRVGLFSGLVVLAQSYIRVSVRYLFLHLKRLIPVRIKLIIRKFYPNL